MYQHIILLGIPNRSHAAGLSRGVLSFYIGVMEKNTGQFAQNHTKPKLSS
jgi:hypothetical protein